MIQSKQKFQMALMVVSSILLVMGMNQPLVFAHSYTEYWGDCHTDYEDCVPNANSPDPMCRNQKPDGTPFDKNNKEESAHMAVDCSCEGGGCGIWVGGCTPNDSAYWGKQGYGDKPTVDLHDGLDNDCDGFIDDEKCNGIDDDGDGLIDEDPGSCLGKILFVPLCWNTGDTRSLEDRVNEQLNVFYDALDLGSCKDSFKHVFLDPKKVNASCPSSGCQEGVMAKVLTAVEQAGINKGDYNEIVGVTNQNICGTIGGQHSGKGYFWLEALDSNPSTFSHEFAHLYGLVEEYSSHEPGVGGCYNDHFDINFLDASLGCDPKGGCCQKCTSDPCNNCCAGNRDRDRTGRCFMASSFDARGYCLSCFNQITNPTNKRTYPAFPQGVVKLKCGEKNPVGPQNIGELSFSLTEDGKLDQVSLVDTYLGRPSFGSFYGKGPGDYPEGPYRIELYNVENTRIFVTDFALGGFFCGGSGCVIEGQTYFMRWKAVLPEDITVTKFDVLSVFFKYTPTTGDPVYSQTTINGNPPSAYAGPYQFVECKNGKGTANLDASGSYDPDGDTLTYAWSAPGITFSDPTGAKTSAVFPFGTTTVTLTVKDGSAYASGFPLMDTDTVDVTVRDTTPPVVTPPGAITIFSCASPNIGTATGVDACAGTTVTITNDAPATFPLGETTVTWTATDASGNIGTAKQKVRAILGDDPSCCPPGTNIIIGTEGNDDLIGTFGDDCILGLGGDDTLNGKKGNDFLSGGAGNDTLVADDGDDYLAGGPGRDNLNAGKGKDICMVDPTDNVVNCEKLIYY